MSQTTVIRAGKTLTVPLELYESMEKPEAMRVVLSKQNMHELMAITPLGFRGKFRLKFGNNGLWVAIHPKVQGDTVVYRVYEGSGADGFMGEYRIANFHPMYCLMPVAGNVATTSHENFWSGVSNYHEHRDPNAQHDWSLKRSDWLAKLLLDTGAKSIFEVGCGAGRNLHALRKLSSSVELSAIEINPVAAAKAAEATGPGRVKVASIYEAANWPTEKFDLVFTSGVLSHLPHDVVGDVVRRMQAIAKDTVIHAELHGPSHRFDYHRYPRDYAELYKKLKDYPYEYDVFPEGDERWPGLGMFRMSLLTSKVKKA